MNAAAFAVSRKGPGNLGRNAVRGLSLWQEDVSVKRSFTVRGSLQVSFSAEAYNVFNHPRFADPVRFLSNPTFGESGSSLNLMMGSGSPASGLAPMFQAGGARSVQVTVRVRF